MKQLRLFLLTILVSFAIAANAVIQSGSCGDNVTFVLNDDGTLVISGTGAMKDYAWNDHAPWYDSHNKISKIKIEDGVTSIGNWAFDWCFYLTSVTMPNSMKTIGSCAFGSCHDLESIILSNSLTAIGERAFEYCTGLTSITIPKSVSSISYGAFSRCTGLVSLKVEEGNNMYRSENNVLFSKDMTELVCCAGGKVGEYTIPNNVKRVGNYAFSSCSELTSVIFSNSVTNIGDYAFMECSGLTSIVIGNSVTSIGSEAFWQCVGLTSIIIPNSVTDIGIAAFSYCSNLVSVNIPNSVTSIRSTAFSNCSNLISVNIPRSVTYMANGIFWGCSELTSIEVDAGNPYFSSQDGVLFNKTKTELLSFAGGKKGDYIIPNSVTTIKSLAFADCSKLTSITIPNNLKEIEFYAFYGCSNLTSINIPNSVTNIGYNVFDGCSKLSSVIIGSSVSSIGRTVFRECTNLKTVICKAKDIPSTEVDVFGGVKTQEGKLYVPQKSLSTYASSYPWNLWGEVREMERLISSISLNRQVAEIPNGESLTLYASISPDNAYEHSVVWDSSDASIASVRNGIVTAHKLGKTIITATTTDGSNLSASCEIIVKQALASSVALSETSKTIKIGDSFTLTATVSPYNTTNKTVQWSSSNSNVASVDNGVVQAKNVGTTTITVKTTDGSNISATCDVKVEPVLATSISLSETSRTLNVGEHFTLSPTILPNNATSKEVSWSSSNNSVASVSNGVVTAVAPGSATITVKTADGSNKSASCVVTVSKIAVSLLVIDKSSLSLLVDESASLSVSVYPTNATNKEIAWTSSNGSVATVNNGNIKAVGAGNAVITAKATDGSGCSASCSITVKKHQQSIVWNQNLITLQVGGEIVELDATSSSGLPVTYKIADESIASYFDMGSKKYVNPNKEGTTTITARQEGNDKYSPAEMTKTVVVQASAGIEQQKLDSTVYHVYRINGAKVGTFTQKEYQELLSQKKLVDGLYIVNGVKVQVKK